MATVQVRSRSGLTRTHSDVPQARVELATFRLGGGCTCRADLRRRGTSGRINRGFTYGCSPRKRVHHLHSEPRHTLARSTHLRDMSTSPNLQHGLPTLLTIHDIAALFRVRRTTAYARTRDPDFPDPLVISGSCYRWYTHEVLAYIDSRRAMKKGYLRRTSSPDACGSLPAVPPNLPRARTTRRQRRTSGAMPSET